MQLIGKYSREYVVEKHPDAEVRYKTDKDGKRTHVGIYLTGGVDLDEKQNYSKQQHRMQLIGTLIPYHYVAGNYLVEHSVEAWSLAAMLVRKQHSETATNSIVLYFLDWCEKCRMAGYPHTTAPKE
jgi:hypothetical protein